MDDFYYQGEHVLIAGAPAAGNLRAFIHPRSMELYYLYKGQGFLQVGDGRRRASRLYRSHEELLEELRKWCDAPPKTLTGKGIHVPLW